MSFFHKKAPYQIALPTSTFHSRLKTQVSRFLRHVSSASGPQTGLTESGPSDVLKYLMLYHSLTT